MTITQTVNIPANCRTIEIPHEVPTGEVIISFTPAEVKSPADQGSSQPEQSINATLRRAYGAWKDNPWTNHIEDINNMRDEWEKRN